MKKHFSKVLSLISVFLLTGCQVSPQEIDYTSYTKGPLTMEEDHFRILQLTDIHFGLATHFNEEWLYFDELIRRADPDLIIMTGDQFMNASTDVANKLYSYINSKGIPWTLTFGNHDRQGFYTPQFISRQETYDEYEHSYYIDLVDDLAGHGNHYLNLEKGGDIKWQFFMIDSGSYHKTGFAYEYGIIDETQIDWYEEVIKETNKVVQDVNDFNEIDEGDVIPSLAFFHIPLHEYVDAWDAYQADEADGEGVFEDSGIWHGYRNSGFFASALKLHSTKGMFVGHDHKNNFAINYQGIVLAYGVKSGRGIYHDPEKIGGRVIDVHADGSFTTEHLILTYEEVLGG